MLFFLQRFPVPLHSPPLTSNFPRGGGGSFVVFFCPGGENSTSGPLLARGIIPIHSGWLISQAAVFLDRFPARQGAAAAQFFPGGIACSGHGIPITRDWQK